MLQSTKDLGDAVEKISSGETSVEEYCSDTFHMDDTDGMIYAINSKFVMRVYRVSTFDSDAMSLDNWMELRDIIDKVSQLDKFDSLQDTLLMDADRNIVEIIDELSVGYTTDINKTDKTAQGIMDTLFGSNAYNRSIRQASIHLVNNDCGEYTYVTQWGSGTTCWQNPQTGETISIRYPNFD